MNVLLINGHPRENSLSDVFTKAYYKGALTAGVQIKALIIREIEFNPNVVQFRM